MATSNWSHNIKLPEAIFYIVLVVVVGRYLFELHGLPYSRPYPVDKRMQEVFASHGNSEMDRSLDAIARAKLYREVGRYADAIFALKECLAAVAKDDQAAQAELMTAFGDTYGDWWRFSDAMPFYEKAFSLHQTVGPESALVADYLSMVRCQYDLARYTRDRLQAYQALAKADQLIKQAEVLPGDGSTKQTIENYRYLISIERGNIDEVQAKLKALPQSTD